ncbi:Uncharacterised protein [BD1-7 clade bacterium]|uniref:Uncharacterized protein n=1 Tax=BD1-7 clade bacterium TaxID=2029982 RepID=A0A5S9PK43_9GAMM|nr:Uncharacterised protein [BD1-7 clade bacterium]
MQFPMLELSVFMLYIFLKTVESHFLIKSI